MSGKPKAYFQILSGAQLGRLIPLYQRLTRLDQPNGDCVMVVRRADGYYLAHLAGAPPTVNKIPIGTASVLLNAASRVQIGSLELQFYC